MKIFLLLLSITVFSYDTLFYNTFDIYDSAKVHFGDTSSYKLTSDSAFDNLSAKIVLSDSLASRAINAHLPAAKYAGKKIYVSALVKGALTSHPPLSYNGIKVM
ncbi:MAG: hypothetical protein JNL74_21245, partial [Fibrobacteres bacterium]|nr:hypothetical protein [Fibrobacterota bacterium]